MLSLYACSSSHYVTTILIHFHMKCKLHRIRILFLTHNCTSLTKHCTFTRNKSLFTYTLSHLMLSCSMASARLLLRKFSINSYLIICSTLVAKSNAQGALFGWFATAGFMARMVFPVIAGYVAQEGGDLVLFCLLIPLLVGSMTFFFFGIDRPSLNSSHKESTRFCRQLFSLHIMYYKNAILHYKKINIPLKGRWSYKVLKQF